MALESEQSEQWDSSQFRGVDVVLEGMITYTDPFLLQVAPEVSQALAEKLSPYIGSSAASDVGQFRSIRFVDPRGTSLDRLIEEITRPFYERCASQGFAGNPRIFATDEVTLPPLKLRNIHPQTLLSTQEFEDVLTTELPKAAAKRGLSADMVAQQLPTICKVAKVIMFDFSKLMRDPGDFVDQALTVAGAYTSGAPAAETKDLELVMDVIGYCEPLQRFFGSRWF